MGQDIREWTKKNLWKTAFKKFVSGHITSNILKAVFHKFVWSVLEYRDPYVMLCTIQYHLYNLKNVKSIMKE